MTPEKVTRRKFLHQGLELGGTLLAISAVSSGLTAVTLKLAERYGNKPEDLVEALEQQNITLVPAYEHVRRVAEAVDRSDSHMKLIIEEIDHKSGAKKSFTVIKDVTADNQLVLQESGTNDSGSTESNTFALEKSETFAAVDTAFARYVLASREGLKSDQVEVNVELNVRNWLTDEECTILCDLIKLKTPIEDVCDKLVAWYDYKHEYQAIREKFEIWDIYPSGKNDKSYKMIDLGGDLIFSQHDGAFTPIPNVIYNYSSNIFRSKLGLTTPVQQSAYSFA